MLRQAEFSRTHGTFPPNRRVGRITEQDAWELIDTKLVDGDRGRDPIKLSLERNWFMYVAYVRGLHAANYGDVMDPDFDEVRALVQNPYSANHIKPMYRREMSRLSMARPDWDVIPRSSDADDQFGAKVAQHHLDYYYERFQLRKMRRKLATWLITCGTGFYYCGWDKRKGKKRRAYKNPFKNPDAPDETDYLAGDQIDEQTRTFLDKVQAYDETQEGDFDVDVLSPFQVHVPSEFTELEQMPWVIVTRLRSVDWLWEHYPQKAAKMNLDEATSKLDMHYWRRLSALHMGTGSMYPTRARLFEEAMEVHELWVAPEGRFPNGAYVVATPHEVLEYGPHPFHESGCDIRFPIDKAVYIDVGGFWGDGLVQDLIASLEDYNRGAQQLITQRDVLSKPQWLSPKGSEMSVTRNDTGDVWEYNFGQGVPTLVAPPPLSQAHVVTGDRALHDMQSIAAQSEVTQAQVPQGVRSGVAIRALQEKDELVLGPSIEEIEEMHTRFGTKLLQLTQKYVSVPRSIAIYGKSRQADIKFFKGADLHDNTDVRIRQGSMMPKSKAMTQQTLLDMLQLQAINAMDPDVQRFIIDAFEFGGLERMFFALDAHRRRAAIENEMFIDPQPMLRLDENGQQIEEFAFPDVDDDDNHEEHLKEHELLRVSDVFETWPEMRKMAFIAHETKHRLAVAKQMQAAMLIQGMGGGAGQGSQPKDLGQPSPPKPTAGGPGADSSAA